LISEKIVDVMMGSACAAILKIELPALKNPKCSTNALPSAPGSGNSPTCKLLNKYLNKTLPEGVLKIECIDISTSECSARSNLSSSVILVLIKT